MKIKLTLAKVSNSALVQGFVELRNLPVSGDQAVLLDRASEKLVSEHQRYHKLRNDWFSKHADKTQDGYEITVGDPRLEALKQYESELGNEIIEIRIVKKFKLPLTFSINAIQYRALLDAGIIEEIVVADEDDPEK